MTPTLYNNVISNIKWNAIESIIYCILMVTHQAVLFRTLDLSLYGLIGSIFSYIFFSELTLCLGLNNSAGTFLALWSKSKKGFRLFFGWNILVNYIFSFFYFLIGFYFVPFMSPLMYALVAIIVIFEKNKQICKTLLHILFKSRLKSYIELVTFISYLLLVWGQYGMGYQLTVYRLVLPLFITSGISCIVFMYAIFLWYKELPENEECSMDRALTVRIIKNRFFAIAHKTSKRFFSSNFLVPMFATRFGMQEAGILKITTQIAYYTTLVLRKAFGNASSALFAHTKHDEYETNAQNAQWITTLLGYATGGIVGCALITTLCLHWYAPATFTPTLTLLIIACFCNAGIMNSLTTLEQWFIIHEKTTILLVAQCTLTAAWMTTLLFSHTISPLNLIIIATVCNMFLFTYLGSIILFHKKNIFFWHKNKTGFKFKA